MYFNYASKINLLHVLSKEHKKLLANISQHIKWYQLITDMLVSAFMCKKDMFVNFKDKHI